MWWNPQFVTTLWKHMIWDWMILFNPDTPPPTNENSNP